MTYILLRCLHWIGRRVLIKNIKEIDVHIIDMERDPSPEDTNVICFLIYFLTTPSNYSTVNRILDEAREVIAIGDQRDHLILLNALKIIRKLT